MVVAHPAPWTSLWLFNNRACREAFAAAYPGHTLVVEGVGAPSGVSDQPMTDEETQTGARNRARNAGTAAWLIASFHVDFTPLIPLVVGLYKDAHGKAPDFAVGLEGGVNKTAYPGTNDGDTTVYMTCFAWMAVWRVEGDQWGACGCVCVLLCDGLAVWAAGCAGAKWLCGVVCSVVCVCLRVPASRSLFYAARAQATHAPGASCSRPASCGSSMVAWSWATLTTWCLRCVPRTGCAVCLYSLVVVAMACARWYQRNNSKHNNGYVQGRWCVLTRWGLR